MLVYLYTSMGLKRMCLHLKNLYPEKRLAKASMSEKVVTELRMRIVSGDIGYETILSENQLAKEYQVSRSPIREALKVLSNENLVRPERMGAVVIGISEKDIAEIYDIRLMIESFVFQRLLKKDNRRLVRELNKMIEMMKIAVKYKDVDEFSLLDIEFHETIIQSIDHDYMAMLWSNLKPVMECLILLSMRYRIRENAEDFERVINNHDLIIESIANKDNEMINQAFYQNFNDVQDKVESLWSNPDMMMIARENIESK